MCGVGVMSKYYVTISIMDQVTYTIETASCDEHAGDLAIELFKQDYPDLNFAIIECEEEK